LLAEVSTCYYNTVAQNLLSWGTEVRETIVLGFPCPTFAQRPLRLSELLDASERFSDREYLVQGSHRTTFLEFRLAVSNLTTFLRRCGVRRSDRVLIFAANSIEWVVAFWSVTQIGGIVVLGNAWWSQSEVQHAIDTVNPKLVLTDHKRRELLPISQPRVLLTALQSNPESVVGDSAISILDSEASEDDPALILFTSGTTGMAKGAVLTHRGLIATLQSLLIRTKRLPEIGMQPPAPSKGLLSLPLFHIGGLQQIITPLVTGGTVVFSDGRFEPEAIIDLIEAEKVSVWSAVPTMVSRVVDYLEASNHRPVESIKTVGMGGSPVLQQLRDRVLKTFPNAGRGVAVTYGLSEACGVVATGAGAEVRERPGTVGRPIPTATIRISDPDENGIGEILVRSPSVMRGYWSDDPANAADHTDPGPVTTDRWLRTGDVGRLDEDGYLYVTDRSKDIVIRGGENVATPNVENRLLEHSAVVEAAVVGLPHPSLGEELGAIVVVQEGVQISERELTEFVADGLAYFEVPTRWQIRVNPLPQNTTGKVLKRVLRQEWIEQLCAVGERA